MRTLVFVGEAIRLRKLRRCNSSKHHYNSCRPTRTDGFDRLTFSFDKDGATVNFPRAAVIAVAHPLHNLMVETNEIEESALKLLKVKNIGLLF